MKKYQIIYADPAWEYKESGSGTRVVKSHYKTMGIEDIKNLPIQDMCDDTCILFIWVTFPRLDHPITQYHARIFELEQQGYTIDSRFIEGKNWKEYKLIPKETLW